MAKRLPWFKFHSVDYQEDFGLRKCSLAARGLWVEMMCMMDRYSEPYGFMCDKSGPFPEHLIASKAACSPTELKRLSSELENNGVFSRDENGVIYSRRMARDGASRAQLNLVSIPASKRKNDAGIDAPLDAILDASGDVEKTVSSRASARALNSEFYISKSSKSKKASGNELSDQQFIWFEKFWSLYWRRVCRKTAEQSFARSVTTPELFETVISAIRAQTAEMLSREPDKRPHAATWLNQQRWLDEAPVPAMSKFNSAEFWGIEGRQ